RVHDAMREIVAAGLAESAHDLSDGGLAVAAAECSMAGIGAAFLFQSDLPPDFLLFHEGPSRILISTSDPEAVAAIAARQGVRAARAGITINGVLAFANRDQTLISVTTGSLKSIWEKSLENQLRA
ncbi:MAG TPA: AIR synthase-related protein, partial [Bryobacteraceae bacterium]|nr:AIR synthase-related protein [Bryobacteraceae bacterium]